MLLKLRYTPANITLNGKENVNKIMGIIEHNISSCSVGNYRKQLNSNIGEKAKKYTSKKMLICKICKKYKYYTISVHKK